MMPEFDLIIFDCDGVVIDSEVISARMLVAELARRGVKIDVPYVVRHFLGRSYPLVIAQIRGEFGVDLPESFEADYRARLLGRFETDLRIIPGIREVLSDLAVPYALATSSSPERVAASLAIVGLSAPFEGRITTSSEVAHGKPAPDIFLKAAQKAGVAPERCLVIEDSGPGVQAGLAAGMTTLHFTGGSHLKEAGVEVRLTTRPDGVIETLPELFHFAPNLKKRTGHVA